MALLSDGASRLVDPFQLATWNDVLSELAQEGPESPRRAQRD